MPFILKNIWEHPTEKNKGIQLNTAYERHYDLMTNKSIQTANDTEKAERRCHKIFGLELSELKYKQKLC